MLVKWIIYCWTHLIMFSLGSGEFVRVCYHTNWAQYRNGLFKFKPENIDPFLCTHIVYAFAKVVGNDIVPYEWNDLILEDYTKDNYELVAALKIKNPNLKITLAIGGWNHGSGPFTSLVDNTTDIRNFALNSITYLRMINFDGLDLDWEYPAHRGSPPEDRKRFTQLCKILREEYENEAQQTGNPRLLLTAAVAAGDAAVTAYEIKNISQELDFIHLMSYDLHGSWDPTLGHNSPLYPRDDESEEEKRLNQEYAINFWLMAGTPKEKLVVGLALYGRSFTMKTTDYQLGAPANGAGTAGPYTREKGFLAYYEVCEKLSQGWTNVWNEEQQVPFAYKGNQWVGYDDLQSIEIKANYIKSHGLGGSMVWAMDLDDFQDTCKQGRNPLMSKIKEVLTDSDPPPPPQPSTTQPTTTPKKTQPTTTAQKTQQPTTTQKTQQPTTSQKTQQPTTTQKTQQPTTTQKTQQPTTTQKTQPSTTPQKTNPPTTAEKTTTTNQPNTCGAPVNCEHGKFYGDACNNRVYYQCANGIPYRYECHPGTVWYINRCEWDYMVPSSSATKPSTTMSTSKIPTTQSPTITSSTTTTQSSTTSSSVNCGKFQCPANGLHADPCDVKSYYNCWGGIAYHNTCSGATVWNDNISNCDWEYNIIQKSNCAPTDCENGFYPDTCNNQVYYQCANGIPYKFTCADGTYWDQGSTNCQWLQK